jgi:hypothetical protein
MHPEAIGRGSPMRMLERFVAEAKALDGVVFDRLDRVVEAGSQAPRVDPANVASEVVDQTELIAVRIIRARGRHIDPDPAAA